MRLKDLHSNDKEQLVSALLVQVKAFSTMITQVEQNDTTLPRLHADLSDAQQQTGRLRVLVARMAEKEVPR